MSKGIKTILIIVLISAATLVCILGLEYIDLLKQLRSAEIDLSESRDRWNTIAAEKEMLQDDLKTLRSDLKEAQLSLEEYETLKEEISSLRQQIDNSRSPGE